MSENSNESTGVVFLQSPRQVQDVCHLFFLLLFWVSFFFVKYIYIYLEFWWGRPTSANLVPIQLDIEIDSQRFKDAFTWNPSGIFDNFHSFSLPLVFFLFAYIYIYVCVCVCVFFFNVNHLFCFCIPELYPTLNFLHLSKKKKKFILKVSTYNKIMWAIARRDQFHWDFTLVELNMSYLLCVYAYVCSL